MRKKIKLNTFSKSGNYLTLVPGPYPYLWIGNEKHFFDTVPDKDIKKLINMCISILEKRKMYGVPK